MDQTGEKKGKCRGDEAKEAEGKGGEGGEELLRKINMCLERRCPIH